MAVLEFERPIVELERKIRELSLLVQDRPELQEELRQLEARLEHLREEVFSRLSRWQKVQLARHPDRPHALDFIHGMTDTFIELHGDRALGDDPSIVAGLARMGDLRLAVIGQEKGRDLKERQYRNFGMPQPEGYRKALRVMKLAEKFGLPILTLVDTPGAYPGIEAEQHGQFYAIARNIYEMRGLEVPIVTVVIGEGGSGGALAIAVADRVYGLQYSIYSVISPEGCASILFRDATRAPEAAEALKLTAEDLLELGVLDAVIPEPLGGAHRDPHTAIQTTRRVVLQAFEELMRIPPPERVYRRRQRYLRFGVFEETSHAPSKEETSGS